MTDTGATPATTPAEPSLVQKLAAEALGTFVLVFIGCGSFALFAYTGENAELLSVDTVGWQNTAAIGLAFGIAIVMMVYAVGRISGGHFNPAVSVGAALGGRISWKDAALYSVAQVVGGVVGGLVLAIVLLASDIGWEFGENLGANGFGDHGGAELLGALLIEIVLTFIFLLVILGVTDARNENPAMAPLAIGLALAAIHFVGIPATGTSVNPARSIGAALWSGGDAIIQLWLFILAPLVGAAIAGAIYPLIFGHATEPVPGSGLRFGGRSAAAVGAYGMTDQFQQQWNQQAGYDQGAYAQGGAAQVTGAQPAAATGQPIIQDGWQWDPVAGQWIPAQQQPPAAPQQQGWAPGDDQTQVRPPQG